MNCTTSSSLSITRRVGGLRLDSSTRRLVPGRCWPAPAAQPSTQSGLTQEQDVPQGRGYGVDSVRALTRPHVCMFKPIVGHTISEVVGTTAKQHAHDTFDFGSKHRGCDATALTQGVAPVRWWLYAMVSETSCSACRQVWGDLDVTKVPYALHAVLGANKVPRHSEHSSTPSGSSNEL